MQYGKYQRTDASARERRAQRGVANPVAMDTYLDSRALQKRPLTGGMDRTPGGCTDLPDKLIFRNRVKLSREK
jgi:hypothetical protein